MNIQAVLPAHNEEKGIEKTIWDLANQTLQPTRILVVADNCTDRTIKIVKGLMEKIPFLDIMETIGNKFKKAGAINQALRTFTDDVEAVLLMDADTRIGNRALEFGAERLVRDEKLAAICSKAGVLSPEVPLTPSSWMLYRLQRLEYSLFDSQRVETMGGIKVVHGMAALHRWSALKQVGFYDEGNLVEDYELTLRYKEAGWKVDAELQMEAWTDVPTSWKEWWIQRLRWNRGGVDALREHGWNKVTCWDILGHFVGTALMLIQLFFLLWFGYAIWASGGHVQFHIVALAVTVIGLLVSLYRLKYLENPDAVDWIIRLLMIPEGVYAYIQCFNCVESYFMSFCNIQQKW